MSSFGSAVINKSNKKFAPKAPAQRKRPRAPTPVPVNSQEDTNPSNAPEGTSSVQTSFEVNKAASAQPTAVSTISAANRLSDVSSTHQASSGEDGSINGRPAKRRKTGDGTGGVSSPNHSAVQTTAGSQDLDLQHAPRVLQQGSGTENVVREGIAQDVGTLTNSNSDMLTAEAQNTPEITVDTVMKNVGFISELERSRSSEADEGVLRDGIVTSQVSEKAAPSQPQDENAQLRFEDDAARSLLRREAAVTGGEAQATQSVPANEQAPREMEGVAQGSDVVQMQALVFGRTGADQPIPRTSGSNLEETVQDEGSTSSATLSPENIQLGSENGEDEQSRSITQAEDSLDVESTANTNGTRSQTANDESLAVNQPGILATETSYTGTLSGHRQHKSKGSKEVSTKATARKVSRTKKPGPNAHELPPAGTSSTGATAATATTDNADETTTAEQVKRTKARNIGQPGKSKSRAQTAVSTESQDISTNRQDAAISVKKTRKPRKRATPKTPQIVVVEDDEDTNNEASANQPGEAEEGEHLEHENPEHRKSSRQQRSATPEGAEDVEINVGTTTMYDLCKDRRQGKKSQREAEFQNIDWTEVAKRRKAAEARAQAGEQNEQEREEAERRKEAAERQRQGPRGPQLRLVNGQMILDTDSASTTRPPAGLDIDASAAIEESDLTKRVNSASWIYAHRRAPEERYASGAKSDPWSDELTEQFYAAIRMFGTDFTIVAKMFPGKTRRMIKNKFVREERSAPERVRAALLGENVPMDMAVYCEAAGVEESEFKDPEALEAELRELDEAQRREIEAQKAGVAERAREKMEAAKAKAEAGKKRRKKKNVGGGGDAGGEEVPMPAEGEVAVAGSLGL